jgi:Smg protein
MFDILMFLFESYANAGSYPDPDKLSLKLAAAGFEDEEISQALNWLSGMKRLTPADYPAAINHGGIRHFAALEQQRISAEALNFLTFWEQSGMISAVEREMIIDRAVSLGFEQLSLDKLKLIALLVLWNQHEDLDPLIVEDLLTPAGAQSLH